MKYLLLICFSFYCLQIFCQSPTEEILVRKAIVEMFDGTIGHFRRFEVDVSGRRFKLDFLDRAKSSEYLEQVGLRHVPSQVGDENLGRL